MFWMQIEQLLKQFKTDPSVAVELYPALSKNSYFVLIRPGSATFVDDAEFLTYSAAGNVRELPIFTSQDVPFLNQLVQQSGAKVLTVSGLPLLKRVREVIVDNTTVLAIDPGTEYGIRLDRSMVLSAILVAAT
jgi:SseB protein N-terminal domain